MRDFQEPFLICTSVPLSGAAAYLGGAILLMILVAAASRLLPWIEVQKGEVSRLTAERDALLGALLIVAAWELTPWLEAQKGESGWAADNEGNA